KRQPGRTNLRGDRRLAARRDHHQMLPIGGVPEKGMKVIVLSGSTVMSLQKNAPVYPGAATVAKSTEAFGATRVPRNGAPSVNALVEKQDMNSFGTVPVLSVTTPR